MLARRSARSALESRTPIARVLVAAVGGEDPATDVDWSSIDPVDLQLAALQHGVAPAVYLHLREQSGVPDEVVRRLQTSHRDQLARHLRTLSDLRQAGAALTEAGITWASVKGPILAERVWPRPDMRAYVDLDLVVDRRRFRDALDVLSANGSALVDRNWPFIREQMRGELTLLLPYGTPLDLHWHLVNDPQLRTVFRFPMDELYARADYVDLAGTQVPTFDAVDSLLHLAYHMVHSGGHKLVWLRDFQLAARMPGLDWDELQRRAGAYGCRLALDVSLRRTERVLGPTAPADLRRGRFAWSALASVADRLRPVPSLPGQKMSGRIVFQSTRASSFASAVTAARAIRQDRTPPDPSASNPLHEVRDDDAAREAYLAAVQGEPCP